jgi:hypothetical protein
MYIYIFIHFYHFARMPKKLTRFFGPKNPPPSVPQGNSVKKGIQKKISLNSHTFLNMNTSTNIGLCLHTYIYITYALLDEFMCFT